MPDIGDIMLVATPGWQAKGIRLVTRGPVNHATVLVSDTTIVEAGPGHADVGRMAFDAYAVTADIDDPLNKVLLALGTRTEDIDGRLAEILARLEGLEDSSNAADLRRKAG